MKTLRIGLCGSTGKMGSAIRSLVEMNNSRDSGSVQISVEIHKESSISLISRSVDVWIDFSTPEGLMRLLEGIHTPLVIGTTGFSKMELNTIERYSGRFPVFLSPNFSLGIEAVRRMLGALPPKSLAPANLSVLEIHHQLKKDTPSGTAKMLVRDLEQTGFPNTPCQSSREGDVLGIHKIRWLSSGEEIEISHKVIDRSIFAEGALKAAEWLVSKPPGIYEMQHLWRRE